MADWHLHMLADAFHLAFRQDEVGAQQRLAVAAPAPPQILTRGDLVEDGLTQRTAGHFRCGCDPIDRANQNDSGHGDDEEKTL